MSFIVKEKFIEEFFSCFQIVDWEDEICEGRKRILSEVNNRISKGAKKYNAILELCVDNNISFEISIKMYSAIKITTFMDNKEWSSASLRGNEYDVSKLLGIEIYYVLKTKFMNLIFIENTVKNKLP